jgi:hemerythrin-like domain-containing protein
LQPGDLARGSAIIDDATRAAGRRPGDIRRLLNVSGHFGTRGSGLLDGPPRQWAEQLAELAVTDGVSAFILGTDDPDDLQRFGEEVAPAVRELVTAHRAGAGSLRPDQAAPAAPEQATGPVTVSATPHPAAPSARDEHVRLGPAPTPEPSTRLSRTSLWDESARPRRAPSPEGTAYTDRGRAVGQHLIDVHDHLREELTRLRSLIDQVREGAVQAAQARSAINEMTMRQNDWTLGAYCASYCRVVTAHHGLEDDSIFPHLRAREPELEPVLDRLAEEHLAIHDVLDGVDRALVAFVTRPEDFTALQDAVDLLTDTLLSHLSYEEREIVEPLARLGFYPGQV